MRFLIPLFIYALVAGCGDAGASRVSVEDPAIRLAPIPGRPAAGYFRLEASPDHGALTGVTSPQAARIEMHQTMASGSMSSMRPLARVEIADGETVVFEPGGRHLMLFDPDPSVAPGQQAELTFHFERGEPVTASATVFAAGEDIKGG